MDERGWIGRRVLFLSGTGGDTRRYRCDYQAEQLRMLGALVAVRGLEQPGVENVLAFAPHLVVFHRARWTGDVARLIDELSRRDTALVYDTDDLVFAPDAAGLVDWPADLTVERRREFFDSHRRVMAVCGLATVSTAPLATAALGLARAAVTPNAVGLEMLVDADAVLAEGPAPDERVIITYLSGTPTHQRDFELVADVLVDLLESYPQTAFRGVGHLQLDRRFERFGARVELLPFQPLGQLPGLLRSAAINLAPLEAGNVFAECKSALKFLEAALVGTPTVASRVPDFERVIEDGVTGFLATGVGEWRRALASLIQDRELRLSVGREAAHFVRTSATTVARAASLGETLAELAGLPSDLAPTAVTHITTDASGRTAHLESALAATRRSLIEAELAAADAEEARALVESLEREVWTLRGELKASVQHGEALQRSLSWRVTRPLRAVRRLRPPSSARAEHGPSARAAVLFVSGAPEVSMRYRCDHQAEQVRLRGGTATIARHGDVDLVDALGRHELVVLHRVAWGPDVEALCRRAGEMGKRVVFDTDDLVFDPDAITDVAALEDLPEEERRLYEEGLHRFRATLEHCDAAIASTMPLADRARAHCDDVSVVPNVASMSMVERSTHALRKRVQGTDVVLGYMSGTNTHKLDFRVAASALIDVLAAEARARLRVVGPLQLGDEFSAFDSRVETFPLQPWSRLPYVQAGVDVNLAPLELDNRFTESKSAIKWIEAGLVGVPTVASPQPDFVRAIRDGDNGFLAASDDDWRRALTDLVRDPALRTAVGAAARRDVLEEHTTKAQAPFYESELRRIAPRPETPLTINWVMYAPIRQNSGGYRNILRIANILGEKGHVQNLAVLPIEHLSGMSKSALISFMDEAFGMPANSSLVVGHDELPEADISIATYWPTAYTVAEHEQSRFKAYFIQDFEPDFYADDDPQSSRAAATYKLPLRHICLGRHMQRRMEDVTGLPAELVDFALDPVFRCERPAGVRNDPARVLYFARPSLRRRGYEIGVEALRILKQAHPDVDVVFFGSHDYELGELPFEIRNLGVLAAEDVARAMNDSDILLTFSLTNISNVPFEGMACGCAVVDIDLPNVSTMVEPDTCLLAPLDPTDLARALASLVEDPDLRRRLGTRGAESVQHRTWERTADLFESALRATAFVGAGALAEPHDPPSRPPRDRGHARSPAAATLRPGG